MRPMGRSDFLVWSPCGQPAGEARGVRAASANSDWPAAHAIASTLQLHFDDASPHCHLHCRVISLGLVGVGEREPAHRFIEDILFAEIAAYHPGIARFRMRAGESPGACLAVYRKHFGIEVSTSAPELYVA